MVASVMMTPATGNTYFYQWDLNQQLSVTGDVTEIHFAQPDNTTALVVPVENGLATIPNILLQNSGTLTAYAYTPDRTLTTQRWTIVARQKAEDYVYTETEVKTWETIEAEAANAIAIARGAQDDFDTLTEVIAADITAAEDAKSALGSAIASANTSKTNLETAINNANNAKTNADTARTNLQNVIDDSTAINNTLGTTNNTASTAKTNLETTIDNASTVKSQLEQDITNAGESQVQAVNNAGVAQVQAVQQEGADQIQIMQSHLVDYAKVEEVSELRGDIADIDQVVMAGYSFNLITDTFMLKDINTWSDVSSLNLSNYTYDSDNFNVYQIHVVSGKRYSFFEANSTTNKLEYLQVPNLIIFDASGNASERKQGQYSFDSNEDGYIAISVYKIKKVVIADHDVLGEDYIEHKKIQKEFAEKKDLNNIEEELTDLDRRVSLLERNEEKTVIPNVVKSKLLAKSINTWGDISSLKTDNYTYDNEDFNNYFAEVTETGRYWFYRNSNGEALDVSFPNIITFDAGGNALERFSSKEYVDVTKNVAFVSFDYNKNYDCMLVKGGYTGNFYGIGEPLRENTRHYDTFSILGDSYSTFDGYLKDERAGSWYPADSTKPNNDVTKVDETWWYQFANNYGCSLIANNSWTGTTIGYDGYSEGLDDGKESSFLKRYNNLDKPELIFIFGGTNDEWVANDTGRTDFLGDYKYSDFSESDFEYFRPSLAKLIDSVQHNNIGAKIVFVLNSGLVKINDSVETICNHYGIDLIKLNNIAKGNSHPTIEGMKTIAYEIEWFLKQRK